MNIPSDSDTDIAYLAGLFDGEGSVCILQHQRKDRVSRSYWLEISIGNTHRGVLEWVHERFGGRLSDNSERYSLRNHRTWRWRASTRDASAILTLMLPHLKVKVNQAKLALEFSQHIQGYVAAHNGTTAPEEIEWREVQRSAISQLNLRNRARD